VPKWFSTKHAATIVSTVDITDINVPQISVQLPVYIVVKIQQKDITRQVKNDATDSQHHYYPSTSSMEQSAINNDNQQHHASDDFDHQKMDDETPV